ncbi:MAG: hypothetical protein PVH96_11050, partial [Gemmatimonadota bacterium]
MENLLGPVFAVLILNTLVGVVLQRRLRRLLEAETDPTVVSPPRMSLDTSPRDSLNFMQALISRRY